MALEIEDQLIIALSLVLRARREGLGLSQSELARLSGLHRSYIGDLERGSRNISVRNLTRLAEAMGVNPSKLMSSAEKTLKEEGPFRKKRR